MEIRAPLCPNFPNMKLNEKDPNGSPMPCRVITQTAY